MNMQEPWWQNSTVHTSNDNHNNYILRTNIFHWTSQRVTPDRSTDLIRCVWYSHILWVQTSNACCISTLDDRIQEQRLDTPFEHVTCGPWTNHHQFVPKWILLSWPAKVFEPVKQRGNILVFDLNFQFQKCEKDTKNIEGLLSDPNKLKIVRLIWEKWADSHRQKRMPGFGWNLMWFFRVSSWSHFWFLIISNY